ncbi:MAG: hypothetical protein Q9193_000169 [Seirophora villosa]
MESYVSRILFHLLSIASVSKSRLRGPQVFHVGHRGSGQESQYRAIACFTVIRSCCRDYGGSQDYVSKILRLNLENNMIEIKGPKEHRSTKKKTSSSPASRKAPNLKFLALDWETDAVGSLPALLASEKDSKEPKIDVVLACDCIYNESLIGPFVRTCEDLCLLAGASPTNKPTICVIAQQLRSPDVFEAWLTAFMRSFRVWRVPDTLLSDGLKENSGFVIHIGVLRSDF